MFLATHGVIRNNGGGGYTARTTAFATATGITDVTILGALNTFDLGLISNSLDTKMKAVYPFVGTTSTTQKYNFMDSRDLDVAFRLSFIGGGTFSSNGYQLNGTNAYANTFLTPSTSLSLDSIHSSVYSRTNNILNTFDITTAPNYTFLLGINFDGNTYFKVNQSTYSSISTTDSLGLRIINRTSSTTEKLYKNNSLALSSSKTSASLPNTPILLGYTEGLGVTWSNRQYSFMSIGSGLTDGEAVIFYNLVQNMQTTLARNV